MPKKPDRPVRVFWGEKWVATVGRSAGGRTWGGKRQVLARVYDPHGGEWFWHKFSVDDVKEGHGDGPAPAVVIVPNRKGLIVLNLAAVSRGTGARYLECLPGEWDADAGQYKSLVAVRWRRKVPTNARVVLDMAPEGGVK